MTINRNIYKGRRYVPKIVGAWDNIKMPPYESLTVVQWGGLSYTSKRDVPQGVSIHNEYYWVVTGNYNAQVEIYRQETKRNTNDIIKLKKDVAFQGDRIKNLPVFVEDFGAVGNGVTDDTYAIQKAVNYCFNNKKTRLSFSQGKTYVLGLAISLNSIVLWGSNLIVDGNGCTIVRKNTTGGFWGNLFDVAGLMDNYNYPFMGTHRGSNIPSENIVVKNFRLINDDSVKGNCNTYSVQNSINVVSENIICINAPQTNYAVGAFSNTKPAENLVFNNCISHKSKMHGWRISLQQSADNLSVTMNNCSSTQAMGDDIEPEIKGRRVHLWYRAFSTSDKVSLKLNNCNFDSTGQVMVTNGAKNLSIRNTTIKGGVTIVSQSKLDTSCVIENNIISGAVKKGATSESPLQVTGLKGFVLRNNTFSKEIPSSAAVGIRNVSLYSVSDALIDSNKNISIRTGINDIFNNNVIISNNSFAPNAKMANGRIIDISSTNGITIKDNTIEESYMFFTGVTNCIYKGNRTTVSFHTGYPILGSEQTLTSFIIQNNQHIVSGSARNNGSWIKSKSGNSVADNQIIQTDGYVRMDIEYRDSPPTEGFHAVGDRVINSAPKVGSPKSWVCTTQGTPGTFTSEGNL